MTKGRNSKQLYEAMRDAILYMRRGKTSIEDVASKIGMSRSRFEHAFAQWAGIPPKRYLAHLVKEKAKSHLLSKDVLKASLASRLSSPGRLHGLMVTHEAVSPGEFKDGKIEIKYGIHESPFGWCVIGITKRGVCFLSFTDAKDQSRAAAAIQKKWPKAKLVYDPVDTLALTNRIFRHKQVSKKPIRLLIKGTNFQVKVWEALLSIPAGKVSSYAEIARAAGSPKAVRAVGTACGNNSIGFLIPCHRVLTSAGGLGGYRWGTGRKESILAWESVNINS